ncbi:MAG: NUDIX domain-containing protein, partial [Deltaproteobacteria bacterium]|nr:NUDIX domain-containing protein [Deltaproteobacteria bacterium]
GIEPHIGKLALPGGYINLGESWQRAATREVEEETGLVVDTAGVRDFRVLSAPDGTVLVFGTAGALPANALDVAAFEPSHETSELCIVRAPQELAFPLHTQVLAEWFARKPS